MKVQENTFIFRIFRDSVTEVAGKTKIRKGIRTGMDQKVTIRPGTLSIY